MKNSIFYLYLRDDFDLQNQISPGPGDGKNNEVESLLSQILPQYFKNGFSDTQAKIVNSPGSSGPQQFNMIPSNSLESTGPQQFYPQSSNMQTPQNLVEALSGKLKKTLINYCKKSLVYVLSIIKIQN